MKATTDQLTVSTRPYQRAFSSPLMAAWGRWSARRGTLVCLQDQESGKSGFGESAPLPKYPPAPTEAPEVHPTGRTGEFADWSARASLKTPPDTETSVNSAALLALNGNTVHELAGLRKKGYRTVKLKVGLAGIEHEWKDLQRLVTALNPGEQLRLDPNRSWDKREWQFWKPRLNGIKEWIQFIEEPFSRHFPPSGWLREANTSPVPLALDESLTGSGLAYWLEHHWPGFWILKPSLLGNPDAWLTPVSRHKGKVVISSAFESGIGLSAVIRIAQHFTGIDHGLGTQAYFKDAFGVPQQGNELRPLSIEKQKDLWERLPNA